MKHGSDMAALSPGVDGARGVHEDTAGLDQPARGSLIVCDVDIPYLTAVENSLRWYDANSSSCASVNSCDERGRWPAHVVSIQGTWPINACRGRCTVRRAALCRTTLPREAVRRCPWRAACTCWRPSCEL